MRSAAGRAVIAFVMLVPILYAFDPSIVAAAPRAGTVAARLGEAQAAALSKDVTDPVIVILKDQRSTAPVSGAEAAGRMRTVEATQAPILSELGRVHATKVHSLSLVNAITATVSPGEAARLAVNPAVSEVVADSPIKGPDVGAPAPETARGTGMSGASSDPIPPGACPAKGQPGYPGEELSLIHADSNSRSEPTARSLGFTGAGVKVAYMAEGIDTDNPDFIRPNGTHVFVDYRDFSGDGLNAPTSGGEAFLDASAIASQGKTYNVRDFSQVPLDGPCLIRVEGVAPGASLVGLKVFAQNGYSTTAGLIEAVNYAVEVDHVNVLNESLGYNPFPTTQSQDILEEFNDAAVAAGTTVTVAAGDAGPADTIGSPDTDPLVINVGASTNFRFYAETGADGYIPPFATKDWISDNISGLSSGGFAQTGPTDDVVAPGDTSFAACTPDVKMYADCTNLKDQPSSVETSGGTSESSPLTAGTAALVIQAYRQSHHGATPTPALIKQIIVSSADDLGHPADEQGSGIVDAYRAVLAAESIPAGRKGPAHGSQILLGTPQMHATALPGTPETFPLTVRNLGVGPTTLNLRTRALGAALDTQTRKVTLNASGPRFFNNYYDVPVDYRTTTFDVAPGRDRLEVSLAYRGNTAGGFLGNVDVVLIDPERNFASDAVPQGDGNAAETEVRYPATGKWTALVFSAIPKYGGTVGPVLLQAQTFDFTPVGTVSPARVTIPAGRSATVQIHETTPAQPGDEGISVVVANTAGQVSSAVVSLRSLVDIADGGRFSGDLTGGNGRQSDLGQTAYYQFEVPKGTSADTLRADLQLSGHQTDPVLAYLVDPDGQTLSLANNSVVTGFTRSDPEETATGAAEVATTDPPAGLWTLILSFTPVIIGTQISTPFSGAITLGPAPASGLALPDSTKAVLAPGKAVTVDAAVKNTSDGPEAYFLDARMDTDATVTLAPQSATAIDVPMSADQSSPSWLVPTGTTSITLSAEAPVPVTFDWGPGIGDPDLGATTAGDNAVGGWSDAPITSGVWLADPAEIGPFGDDPPPTVKTAMAATVQTQPFDPSVTSLTGDMWLQSVDPSAQVKAVVVQAGQEAEIPVTITPSGRAGNLVSGTLYVDELSELPSLVANSENYQPGQGWFQGGAQVAALPYEYKVGA
jgi:hypothetical protein